MERLAGRVALITGAASGIGRATAKRLAAEGAAVMVTDVDDEGGKAVAGGLGALGLEAAYLHLDVASEQEWQRAVEETGGQFGGLDILVNNAGVRGETEAVEETSLASWERSIAILQTGVFLGLKCAAPALFESGHASVVNISSVFGASGGVLGTARSQRDLRWIMSGLNVYMVNLPHVYVGGAAQKFADGKLTDQGARDFIKQLLENLRDLTLRLRPR